MPLDTLRLLFEPLQPGHAGFLFAQLDDPRVYEHIPGNVPANAAALADQFAHMASGPTTNCANERWINFAVRLRADGTLIGRLQATVIAGRAEVAYLLGPNHWGHGYAVEGMTAFQEHLQLAEMVSEYWAATSPHNTRSIRLLERLGYSECDSWPALRSYDMGDLVFVLRQLAKRANAFFPP